MKAERAFVRSRKKWFEEEQNTAYFFQQERAHGKSNSIQKLNINNIITDDSKKIANYCSTFYRNLCESQYNKSESDNFFAHLNETKSISDDQKSICDCPLTPNEILFAMKHLHSINLQELTA